jgi:hypothetical protein
MSTNEMESALWKALSNPRELRRLVEDAPGYLSGFKLDETERDLMLAWDVRQLVARGVNPLLLMSAFSAVNGMEKMGEYAMAINQPG